MNAGAHDPAHPPAQHQAPPVKDVLLALQVHGLLDHQSIPEIQAYLEAERQHSHQPWYLSLLQGLGAWVAAICFVSFLTLLGLLGDSVPSLFVLGTLFIGAGIGLNRVDPTTFQRQLALAVSLAGKGMVLGGFSLWLETSAALPLGASVLLVITYPFTRDPVERFIMGIATLTLILVWRISEAHAQVVLNLLLLVEVGGVAVLFCGEQPRRDLMPLGYACAVAIPATLLIPMIDTSLVLPFAWPARILLIPGLIALYAWAAGGRQHLRELPLQVACAATLVLGLLTSPGLLAAIGLLVLGYARHDRILMGLALVFMPAFIVLYYYHLEVTLFSKAWVLIGSGAVLLLARAILEHRFSARKED